MDDRIHRRSAVAYLGARYQHARRGECEASFNRVLYVATGSGIGPVLGHLLTDRQGAKLVWVTRAPRETFGGKPDVFEVSYEAYVDSGADAVIIVSNRPVTAELVRGFERRGVPAFGPIWDS